MNGHDVDMSTVKSIADFFGVAPGTLAYLDKSASPHAAISISSGMLSLRIDIPFDPSWEKRELPPFMKAFGEAIQKIGQIVVDSTAPGSMIVICIANNERDIDKAFAAFAMGELDALRITDVRRLPPPMDESADEPQQVPTSDTKSHAEGEDPVSVMKTIAKGMLIGGLIGSVVPVLGTFIGIMVGGFLAVLYARANGWGAKTANRSRNSKQKR